MVHNISEEDWDAVLEKVQALRDEVRSLTVLLNKLPTAAPSNWRRGRMTTEQIVADVARKFPTFGGERRAGLNPLAAAFEGAPAVFAAGVDVKQVVEHVLACAVAEPPL